MKNLALLFIIFFCLQPHIAAQISEFKLLPDDGAEGEYFGSRVSISGEYAIIGVHNDDDNGSLSGSAYIFKRNGNSWIEEQKLLASDGSEEDFFGISVSILEDYAIVGAYYDDDDGYNSGSAYIFKNDGNNWIEYQKLTASDGGHYDNFGSSVSISDNYIIVGAYWDTYLDSLTGFQAGSAYIFRDNGSYWEEEQKLTASDASLQDIFGISVSISGDYAIIAARNDDDNGLESGSAYIFKRNGNSWIEEQKLLASDGSEEDFFGNIVSISGDYSIVGAPWNDDNGSKSGSAYIFKRDGNNWIEEQKLLASDGAEDDWFGGSVSISGDYVIIGAPGNDDNGISSGSAYIYRNGNNWIEEQKLLASDGTEEDGFGGSVSISGDYVIASATGDDHNGLNSGSAYVYNGFITGVENENFGQPISFRLHQNYPNPFNPTTTINYQIPKVSFVTLKVYDVLGNEIATLVNKEKPVGSYEVEFNATDLPSGIYFYSMQTGSFVETKKMMLLK